MKAAWFGKAVLTTRVWTKPLMPWRPLLLSGWNKTLEEERMLAESKALCKRIGPFAKRAFQHAAAYGLRLSARRLGFAGFAGRLVSISAVCRRAAGSIISRSAVIPRGSPFQRSR